MKSWKLRGIILKSLLKTSKNKKLEALCKQLYKDLTIKTISKSIETYGYAKNLLINLNKQLERYTSKITSVHKCNGDVYKVPIPICGVVTSKQNI